MCSLVHTGTSLPFRPSPSLVKPVPYIFIQTALRPQSRLQRSGQNQLLPLSLTLLVKHATLLRLPSVTVTRSTRNPISLSL